MLGKIITTDSLKIDSMPCGSGVVGMTSCPGYRMSHRLGARRDREVAVDLQTIADWGATTLVTLVERFELKEFGIPNLGAAAEVAGLEWLHLPIEDFSVPDRIFERQWVHAGHKLRNRLRGGDRIVLHCFAGLGRTGIVAARLAIELGATPENALNEVRAARNGAVVTVEQEEYVLKRSFVVPEGDCS